MRNKGKRVTDSESSNTKKTRKLERGRRKEVEEELLKLHAYGGGKLYM